MNDSLFFDKLQKKRKKLALQLKDPAAAGFWNLLVDKYSDQAHFLYELLQNSDDANANNIRIFLFEDHLEYLHNGNISFTISDPDKEEENSEKGHLNALTSVGNSTKNEEDKIGKFGIGFKSVFQYSSQPHVEDDFLSFDLIDYIVPEKCERKKSERKQGETLFYLPFNNPQSDYKEIEKKLLSLHLPTLFLQNISSIFWESRNNTGEYKSSTIKKDKNKGKSIYLKEFSQAANNTTKTNILYVFAENYPFQKQPNQVAFYATKEGKILANEECDYCYCFFKTKTDSGLKFLVHAPFVMTSNRESLKEDNEWNELLQDQLAKLAVEALEYLCHETLIGDEILDFIPFSVKRNGGHPFQKFHNKFIEYLKDAYVFRSLNGNYFTAKETLYTSSDDVKRIFQPKQLTELNLSLNEWCFCTINNEDEVKILNQNQLIAQQLSFSNLAAKCTPDFLAKQELNWLIQFYATANKFTECWQSKESPFKKNQLLLGNDNTFYTLYSDDSTAPQLYLSSGLNDRFLSVHPALTANEKSLRFFKNLGISEPGRLAEILQYTLPRYQNGEISSTNLNQIGLDFKTIIDCYKSLAPFCDEKKQLVEQLRKSAILPAHTSYGECVLKCGDDCCISTPLMREYFSQYKEIFFLDNEFILQEIPTEDREIFYQIMSEIGVHFGLIIKENIVNPTSQTMENLSLKPVSLRQYDKGAQIIRDKIIVGFENFASHLTPQRSAAFFQLLKKEIERESSYLFRLSLQGEYHYIEKGKKHYTKETITSTSAVQSLFNSKWLYNKEYQLCTPYEISESNNLSDIYDISATDALFFLGIKLSPELSLLTPTQREAIAIVNEFKSNGITIPMMKEILTKILEKER